MTTGRINQVTRSFFAVQNFFPLPLPPSSPFLIEREGGGKTKRKNKNRATKTCECLCSRDFVTDFLSKKSHPVRDCREKKKGIRKKMPFSALVAPSRLDRSPGRRPLQGVMEEKKKKK